MYPLYIRLSKATPHHMPPGHFLVARWTRDELYYLTSYCSGLLFRPSFSLILLFLTSLMITPWDLAGESGRDLF